MNKKTSVLIATLIGVAIAATTTGCRGPEPGVPSLAQPVCLGFVVGQRSNSATVTGPMVSTFIPDSEQLAVGSVIVVTGVSGSANGDPLYTGRVKDGSSYDVDDSQVNTRTNAIKAVTEAAASSAQADVLGAIEATAKALKPAGLACTIHVLDSGLQTAGEIRFQNQDLLAVAPEDVVADVPEAETLAGFAVVFDTIGAVVYPQPPLDSQSLTNLTLIWRGVVTKRGGTFQEPDQVAVATRTAPAPGLPEVDVVPVPDRTIDFGDLKPACTPTSTTWQLPGDVLFAPDDHHLKDSAKALLDPVAQILLDHPEATASLVGHSASVSATPEITQRSIDRAAEVRAYLVSLGIDASRITSEGVGDTQPTCEDWDPNTGQQIDACAVRERRVDLVVQGLTLCVD